MTTNDQTAFVEREIAQRLSTKLDDVPLKPQYVLDLGCGTGYFTSQLQNRFPHAVIMVLDIDLKMANFVSNPNMFTHCCADAAHLPFADNQFDLIFTNCCLPYISNVPAFFIELQRVLTIDGLLLFSTYSPDTLDMHILGDLLMQQNYKNPVVDMERLYADLPQAKNLDLLCNVTFEVIYGMAWKQQQVYKQYKDEQGNTYIPINEITYK